MTTSLALYWLCLTKHAPTSSVAFQTEMSTLPMLFKQYNIICITEQNTESLSVIIKRFKVSLVIGYVVAILA